MDLLYASYICVCESLLVLKLEWTNCTQVICVWGGGGEGKGGGEKSPRVQKLI